MIRSKIKITKTSLLIILAITVIGSFSIALPSLANYQNKNALELSTVWEGDEATSYRSGTGLENDPYIIASGSELSYFKKMLESTDYDGVYFKLSNDILLNEGIFSYTNEEKGVYVLNGNKYYVQAGNLYSDVNYTNKVGVINSLGSLSNFKGVLDGAYHTIFGFYNALDGGAFFENLTDAEIKNVNFVNAYVENMGNASILSQNANNSIIENVTISGCVYGQNASALISLASNVQIKNVASHANIYARESASAFIIEGSGIINIMQSYNAGQINAIEASGIMMNIHDGDVNITNYYNAGSIVGNNTYSLFKEAININVLNVIDSFNTASTQKNIELLQDSNLTLNNYYAQTIEAQIVDNNGNYIASSLSNNNYDDLAFYEGLNFNLFISNNDLVQNPSNVWILENNKLPSLYIEKINDSFVSLTVLDNTWDDLHYDLSEKYYNKNLSFSINSISNIRPIKEAYYYISDKELTKDEIASITNWNIYSNPVNISDEGRYVIYVKVIDLYDTPCYLNSDLLITDFTQSDVTILALDKVWQNKIDNLNYFYITPLAEIEIKAEDLLSGVSKIEYAMTSTLESNMDSLVWQEYAEKIIITKAGSYILYAKVTDKAGNISYINTDYLVYGGYIQKSLSSVNVTNKSQISYNYLYTHEHDVKVIGTHHLVFSSALPVGTKIILQDNVFNKVYTYKVNKQTQNIPLADFLEIGKGVMANNFIEKEYEGLAKEDFTVSLDFSKTSLASNLLDLKVTLALYDSNNKLIRSTLDESYENANIYAENDSNLIISSESIMEDILYDNSFTAVYNLKSDIIYSMQDDLEVNDNSLSKQKMGLEIILKDETGNVVSKNNLKNWQFKFNNVNYSPDNDGIIRIKWQDQVALATGVLEVSATEDVSLLKGAYTLNLKAIISYDGMYGANKESNILTIPVTKASDITYGSGITFKQMDNYEVLYRKDGDKILDYLISFDDANIMPICSVTLYKKEKLTAYDQNYITVDNNQDKIYNLTQNEFGIRLEVKTNSLEPGGYKFVFSLSDSEKKIAQYSRYFIVR